MAVPKDNRPSGCETNPFFLELFREHSDSDDRERSWHAAIAHAGQSTPALRFPAYEALYLINVHAQKMVELLQDMSLRLGIGHVSCEYHQSLIQFVRASASQDIAEYMSGVELTEEWLFERQRIEEEKRFRDPDDVYHAVRDREAERAAQGLRPLIEFVDQDKSPEDNPSGVKATTNIGEEN
jgi:hypothetical protein